MKPEHTHVVVVNDNPEFLDLMADMLEDEHYPVTVIDGDRDDAIDLVRAAVPDALIIDLRLGRDELHGWEVLQEIRRDPALRELPTLICTASQDGLEQLAGQIAQSPRVDTIAKPFKIDDLFAKLRSLVELEPV